MAFISMKTGVKLQGLINVSGFHVDPGYEGKLLYSVFNASPSPIHLCEGDRLFKVWFCDLDRESAAPFVYDKKGLTDIGNDLIRGMNKGVLSLQTVADKLAEQKPLIDHLHFVWRATVLGVIVTDPGGNTHCIVAAFKGSCELH